MLASTLINLCGKEYQDAAFGRIFQSDWLGYLNDAQLAVVLVRPDANSVTRSLVLVAGTKQSLPTGGLRLLDIVRNMGADGLTPGRAIRFLEPDVQDSADPNWHTNAPGGVAREVYYNDKRAPLVFYVNPPATASPVVQIEAAVSMAPTLVTDPVNGLITISDVYAPAIEHWMMFKAYSLATQAMGQFQRAQFYYNSFFNVLGVKLKGEMFFAANAAGMMSQVAHGNG